MTYAEIADMRGCSRAAAERWTQRQKLRRQPGNDGKTRVLVAPNVVAHAQPRSAPDRSPRTDPTDMTPVLAAFEQALSAIREAHAGETAALREQHAGETSTLREQLNAARTEATDAGARAEAAQIGQAEAEADAAELRRELAVAQHDAKAAQQSAEVLRQADVARKARGRWSRLRAAWRGE
jgi:hypothetical protein